MPPEGCDIVLGATAMFELIGVLKMLGLMIGAVAVAVVFHALWTRP